MRIIFSVRQAGFQCRTFFILLAACLVAWGTAITAQAADSPMRLAGHVEAWTTIPVKYWKPGDEQQAPGQQTPEQQTSSTSGKQEQPLAPLHNATAGALGTPPAGESGLQPDNGQATGIQPEKNNSENQGTEAQGTDPVGTAAATPSSTGAPAGQQNATLPENTTSPKTVTASERPKGAARGGSGKKNPLQTPETWNFTFPENETPPNK